jgi:RNA polymerase sigma-70 factor (ECF subfamily)
VLLARPSAGGVPSAHMGEIQGSIGGGTAESAATDRPAERSGVSSEPPPPSRESRIVVRELLERGRRHRERRGTHSDVTALSSGEYSNLSASNLFSDPTPEVPEGPPHPEAFLELFHEYERYVASIGSRILGSNNGVDDLVQEVFLVIYQEFHKLRGLSSIKAWLATIATRLAWRQRGRPWLFSKLSLAQVEEVSPLESTDASPELQADLSALLARLRSLPPTLREPWLLRFIDGETLPRIAELCDCSQSTVQRRLREASDVMLGSKRAEIPGID